MSKSTVPWALAPSPLHPATAWRRRAAHGLRCLGLRCVRVARRWMHAGPAPEPASAHLEFHAEAGAPEGALYVDGQRVGTLPGVTRL